MIAMSNNTDNNSMNENKMKQYNDAIIAIEYIVHELKTNQITDLARVLEDITQLHIQTQSIVSQNEDQRTINEYQSILYTYFIEKYYTNIRTTTYRNKILDFFKNECHKCGI
jgi:hypothetical protein